MCQVSNHAWWTSDELRFIRKIAEKKDGSALAGYAASIERRENWGRIDRAQVLAELAVIRTREALAA